MKYGDDMFVNDYGNNGYMFIGTSKYMEGIRCIKFYETSTAGNCLTFEYHNDKNTLTFINGSYHLTQEQCKILEY